MKILLPLFVIATSLSSFLCTVPGEKRDNTPLKAPLVRSDSVTFAVLGDYGVGGIPELQVANMIKNWSPDLIITVGDNDYLHDSENSMKKHVGAYYEDFIYNPDAPERLQAKGKSQQEKRNRFFPTPGNHDYMTPNQLQPYLEYFTLPGNERWYDFRWGPVHFFALDSGPMGQEACCNTEQSKWLKRKLKRSKSPWKVVYFHHPPYSFANHGSNPTMQWPFWEWGATTVMCGHDHVYSRILKKAEPEFPYFISGLGGNPYLYACGVWPVNMDEFEVKCYAESFGAMRVRATDEKIDFEFFSIADPENPWDSYSLSKK